MCRTPPGPPNSRASRRRSASTPSSAITTWWYDVDGVRKALRKVHIPLMENDAVLLGRPGARFWLLGIGDQLAHWIGHSEFRGEGRSARHARPR